MPWPASIGVYADLIYARKDGAIWSNMAFGEYLAALTEQCDRVVLFGRLTASGPAAESCVHPLGDAVEFIELPYYSSVADVRGVYRSIPSAAAAFAYVVNELDCVWLFGPHPISLRFAKIARKYDVPVALGVRQDQPTYMRNRLTGVRKLIGVPFFEHLERRWRKLARSTPTLTAGEQLAGLYGGPPDAVSTAFSLIRAQRVAGSPVASALAPLPDDRPVRLLSVGRIDPEKNPLLMPAIVARLRELAPRRRWLLTVVGDGPLEQELRAGIARLGVEDAVELAGYVPFGEQLDAHYRQSDMLLHVSYTEGLPQVLIEAMAAGLPIVGTDVGGVAAAVAGTGTPLVPADDADAAATAIAALADDDGARRDQAERGLDRAREMTVEAQQRAVLDHIAERYGKADA